VQLVEYSNSAIVDRDHGSNPFTRGHYERFRFMNGYGASVIQNSTSYGGDQGLLEIAVLRYRSDAPEDYELCYDTPITSDVIGYLTQDHARAILDRIAQLPPDAKALAGAKLD
jgi:hypothetical protein